MKLKTNCPTLDEKIDLCITNISNTQITVEGDLSSLNIKTICKYVKDVTELIVSDLNWTFSVKFSSYNIAVHNIVSKCIIKFDIIEEE